ncbi:DUF6270 domain-containing protein [Rhizobium sp. AP16]|uniref:DUF6270 domain-containing protein n=1 Tax=Rhizobium sp. AP16 TaxID=1144306 RepID=UPI00026ED080|nr:DUF6270 domain-containing protein [Rhizobium sp. AP16]EJK81339.1 hypothetical protein PMI03_04370 [Rhizobium sp. AP16]
MSVIAYYGSCPSEEFVKYAFSESKLGFFCYGINVASFMDDRKASINAIEQWPEQIKKKLLYEAKKGFRKRLKDAAPQTLVMDFSRMSRASIMRHKNSILTVPYELLEADPLQQLEAFRLFKIVPFGSREFWRLATDALQKFCDFLNAELPETEVIFLDVPPTADYRGSLTDSNSYITDFCRWQMRYPICRMLIEFCLGRIKHSRVLTPSVALYSNDAALYGPAPMHYAADVWIETAAIYHANGGFHGLPRSCDLVSTLTNYSGLMDAFSKTALSKPNLQRFGLDILHGALPYLFAKIQSPTDSHFDEPIDSPDVVAAFRWILGREPESAETFLNHYALANRRELRDTLLRSFEFQHQVKCYANQ